MAIAPEARRYISEAGKDSDLDVVDVRANKNQVPAEMHIWESGGHGFGLRGGERPVDRWTEQLEPWLRLHGHVK